jgi:leucyl aminopeptidase (aminopeptidase T)
MCSRRRSRAPSRKSAYDSGARYVTVLYWDQHAKRARLRHAPADSLDFVPDWYERLIADCIDRRSAVIVVWGDPERRSSQMSTRPGRESITCR